MYQKTNFAISTLAGAITGSSSTLTMATGQGARFSQTGSFIATLWSSAYPNAIAAYWANKACIVALSLSSGDTFNITWGLEGTSAPSGGFSIGDHIDHDITALT